MSRPTRRECDRAIDLGETARRGGRPVRENPHANDSTLRGRILADCWEDGWRRADAKVRA